MRFRLTHIIISAIAVSALGFLFSCTNQKNTFVHRTFHNITSRYNGLFYARENVKEAVMKLEAAHKDDYNQILPVYKLADEAASKAIFPDLEKAYKKASNVIKYHSISIKGKEYVNWIDEAFVVIGQTHYYKRNYFEAVEVFDYVSKQYRNQEGRYDAMIWMIRSYNEIGSFGNSQRVLDVVNNDKKFPDKYADELATAYADYLIKKEAYSLAPEQLLKAIGLTRNKKRKARLTYILAQVYQKAGDQKKAADAFGRVVKMGPAYEMAFQAKLNRAKLVDAEAKNTRLAKAELEKMAKDPKNKEYLDQIYYTLAQIALKEKDNHQAIQYLAISAANATVNNYQKALTYLQLGELYLEKPEYYLAQAYYDSTVTILPKGFPDYEGVVNKKTHLSELIKNLRVVERQDSILAIVKMSPEQREKFFEEELERREKEEEEKRREMEARLRSLENAPEFNPNQPQDPGQGAGAQGGTSAWYFYNPATLGTGAAEFTRKWGDRPLEDNWRRRNKAVVLDDVTEEGEAVSGDTTAAGSGPVAQSGPKVGGETKKLTKEDLAKGLPLSASAQSQSHEKIQEALYNAAGIYKEQLNDPKAAIKTYEDLISRYDTSKFHVSSYYALFRLYGQVNDAGRAEKYKNILLTRYPESPYAKLARNPEFVSQVKARKEEIEDLYEATYQKLQEREFSTVIYNANLADSLYNKSPLNPMFQILKAMAIGGLQGPVAYEESLKEVAARYDKKPEIKARVTEMLEAIKGSKPVQQIPNESGYRIADSLEHRVVFIFSAKSDINTAKTAVSNFNNSSFASSRLTATPLMFDPQRHMIVITGFKDKKQARSYYLAAKADAEIASSILQAGTSFYISSENYPIMSGKKDLSGYMDFFAKAHEPATP